MLGRTYIIIFLLFLSSFFYRQNITFINEVIKINDYKFFIGRIKQALSVQDLTNTDLANMTGLSKKTIDAFMCRSGRKSERTAELIAKALQIER